MYEYRKLLKKAAKAMSVDVTTRLNTADIMTLCGELDPVAYRNFQYLFVCCHSLL